MNLSGFTLVHERGLKVAHVLGGGLLMRVMIHLQPRRLIDTGAEHYFGGKRREMQGA